MTNKKTAKPVIFISYATEDEIHALWIKKKLLETYNEEAEVFVSKYISAGLQWREAIEETARNSSVAIALLSPTALKKMWIIFEAGIFKCKKIPYVPLLFKNAKIDMLPNCISDIQATVTDNSDSVEKAFETVQKAINSEKKMIIEEIKDYFVKVKRTSGSRILMSNSEVNDIAKRFL